MPSRQGPRERVSASGLLAPLWRQRPKIHLVLSFEHDPELMHRPLDRPLAEAGVLAFLFHLLHHLAAVFQEIRDKLLTSLVLVPSCLEPFPLFFAHRPFHEAIGLVRRSAAPADARRFSHSFQREP